MLDPVSQHARHGDISSGGMGEEERELLCQAPNRKPPIAPEACGRTVPNNASRDSPVHRKQLCQIMPVHACKLAANQDNVNPAADPDRVPRVVQATE